MIAPDPYSVLGVPRDAPQAAIRRAYRKKAKQAHPDRDGGDHETMAQLNHANALIGDESARAKFDAGETQGPRPSLEQAAIQALCQALQHEMDRCPVEADLIERIGRQMEHQFTGLESRRQQTVKQLDALERRLKRLKFKGATGGDFLGYFLQQQINAARNGLEEIARGRETFECALRLLQAYQYEADKTPPRMPPELMFAQMLMQSRTP